MGSDEWHTMGKYRQWTMTKWEMSNSGKWQTVGNVRQWDITDSGIWQTVGNDRQWAMMNGRQWGMTMVNDKQWMGKETMGKMDNGKWQTMEGKANNWKDGQW